MFSLLFTTTYLLSIFTYISEDLVCKSFKDSVEIVQTRADVLFGFHMVEKYSH